MIPAPPSQTNQFVEWIAGANDFYCGRARPTVTSHPFGLDFFNGSRRNGWDFAQRMAALGARHEARHATVH